MKKNRMLGLLVPLLAITLVVSAAGCGGTDEKKDTTTDTVPEVTDTRVDEVTPDVTPDTPADETPAEVIPDVPTEDATGDELSPLCPASCQTTVPSDGDIGAPCVTSATCDNGATCIPETAKNYNGETYVSAPGGECLLYGPGDTVCNPDTPGDCPTGSTCLYFFENMGQEYYGCMDSCQPYDSSKNVYDYNCGCREGYECNLNIKVCVDGCSNDRECCERWWDLNDDNNRSADEVVVKSGCTNTCDNEPAGICQATHGCNNVGDTANVWGGPCEGDAWCPTDGRCLDDFHYADDEGTPYFPGGLCIKDACDLVGRGCDTFGGGCANLGNTTDPFWACVKTCHFGREIEAADYECRKTPAGQENACFPVDPDFWKTAPSGGVDGFCWPGSFPATPGTGALGAACTEDTDCLSPFGLGICASFGDTAMSPYCTMQCSEHAAEEHALCGGDAGGGVAGGACFSGICWQACATPDGAPGSNGCTLADYACYDTTMFGSNVFVATGTTAPTGICIPKCTNNAWCADFWGTPLTCNTTSGVCGS